MYHCAKNSFYNFFHSCIKWIKKSEWKRGIFVTPLNHYFQASVKLMQSPSDNDIFIYRLFSIPNATFQSKIVG